MRPVRAALEFLIVLIGVILVTFLFMQWLPGDPARLYAGEEATEDDIQRVRERLGLDGPWSVQLYRYASRLVQGDLGVSLRSGKPVISEILPRFRVTLALAGISSLTALLFTLPVGIFTGNRPNAQGESALDWLVFTILSVPVYWMGLLLILLVAVHWRLLPPAGSDTWRHLLLPGLTLGLHTGAATSRILKASLNGVLRREYLQTARGKGAGPGRVLWIHALPNALIPTIAYFGLESGRLLGGAVLTETVFAVNGMGRFLVQAIAFRDYPVVVAVVLWVAVAVSFANFLADLFVAWVDPRTRTL